MNVPVSIALDAQPRLRRGVRLMHNDAQGGWMLAGPERMFKIDPIAREILTRCDGTATLAGVIDDLMMNFKAPRERVEQDVMAMLTTLAEKQLIEF